MINTTKMVEILKDVPVGSKIFVSYNAGRRPGPKAAQECARAEEEGINLRHFTGKLEGVHVTKKGQHYFTLWVEERDSIKDGVKSQGNFRAFNPALGALHTLEVLEVAAPQAQ
jgi:hypothetical protein